MGRAGRQQPGDRGDVGARGVDGQCCVVGGDGRAGLPDAVIGCRIQLVGGRKKSGNLLVRRARGVQTRCGRRDA
jgi:hypothetical protein